MNNNLKYAIKCSKYLTEQIYSTLYNDALFFFFTNRKSSYLNFNNVHHLLFTKIYTGSSQGFSFHTTQIAL